MSTAQIASRLAELCRKGEFVEAHKELFADDAISVEPDSTPETTARGRPALAEKSRIFGETYQMHSFGAGQPIVAGDAFALTMTADVTDRKSGARMALDEIGVYQVKDGKIVKEQFFYTSPG